MAFKSPVAQCDNFAEEFEFLAPDLQKFKFHQSNSNSWVLLIHQCSVSSSLFPVKYFFFLQSIPIHPTDNDTFLNIIGVLACHTENINKNGEVGRLVPLIDSRGRIPHQVVVTITSLKKCPARPHHLFHFPRQIDNVLDIITAECCGSVKSKYDFCLLYHLVIVE